MARPWVVAALVAGLCGGATGAIAADTMMETFFRGRTTATGTFSAINGVKREFDVVLTGRVRGGTLTLREDFTYSDGKRERKTWRFVRTGPTTYSGMREDVIGSTVLRVNGNVARFTYLIDLEPGPGRNVLRFYDTLVLSADGRSIANSATAWKFIFPVARVKVDFRK